MATIELVMLDCDGVLIDSEYLAAKVESERYSAWGFEISPEEFAPRFAGLSEEAIAREVEAETGRSLPENFVAEMVAAVRDRIVAEVELIEGADRMVADMPYRVCVCSNSAKSLLEQSLGRVGLWQTLGPHVFSARDLGVDRMKPEPDVYLEASTAMGADPRQAIVVEDSVHGVEGGVRAGARVIGFTGGRHSYRGHADALTEAGATTIVARHRDIIPTIQALAQWDERDLPPIT